MGYNITYDELRNMQGMMNAVINDWLFDYDVLMAKFGEIVKDESMQGETAESLKQYIGTIQMPMLTSIQMLLKQFSASVLMYIDAFYDYESYRYAKINEDLLDNLTIDQYAVMSKTEEICEEINRILGQISDIDTVKKLSADAYYEEVETERRAVGVYKSNIADVDYSYATTETNHLRELITAISDAVYRLHENTPETITAYTQGVEGIESRYLEEIQGKLEAANAYTTAHMERIQYAQERQAEVWKLIEGDIADERFFVGELKCFTAFMVFTTVAIIEISSVGTATPFLVVAAPEMLHEAAEFQEGVQDIGYALKGDAHTTSFNFVRDGILQGDQFAYDMFGMTSSGLFAIATPVYSYTMAIGDTKAMNLLKISTTAEAGTTIATEMVLPEISNALNVSEEEAFFFSMAAGAFIGALGNKFGERTVNRDSNKTLNVIKSSGNIKAKVNAGKVEVGKSGSGSKFKDVFDLADNYNLSDDTFNNHILDRHGPNSLYGNKSHFNADFDIKNGIDSTLKGDNFIIKSNTAGRDGYIFEQTFTNPIGTNSKGKPLYTIKVVIDEFGNVVTVFPKK